jgi:hypothetical protein
MPPLSKKAKAATARRAAQQLAVLIGGPAPPAPTSVAPPQSQDIVPGTGLTPVDIDANVASVPVAASASAAVPLSPVPIALPPTRKLTRKLEKVLLYSTIS